MSFRVKNRASTGTDTLIKMVLDSKSRVSELKQRL